MIHNETTNIWSHLLGALFFTLLAVYLAFYFYPPSHLNLHCSPSADHVCTLLLPPEFVNPSSLIHFVFGNHASIVENLEVAYNFVLTKPMYCVKCFSQNVIDLLTPLANQSYYFKIKLAEIQQLTLEIVEGE